MKKIRTLVVDDSALVRQTLTELLSSTGDIEVIGTARDPVIAMEIMKNQRPDVVTLDLEMPRMDGLEFLQRIMTSDPLPVVICSSLVGEGTEAAIRALELGAVEVIGKPRIGTKHFLEESRFRIANAIRAASLANLRAAGVYGRTPVPRFNADAVLKRTAPKGLRETTERVVVAGASTGGTEAVRVFLEAMPSDAPGIVIVQHMPEHFTRTFARRLDGLCAIKVKEAQDNDAVLRGRALIAPGNKHLLLRRSGARYRVNVVYGEQVNRHRPSVDVLFRSAASAAGRNAVGVIMTGMGDDGAEGLREMREAGAVTYAQDEASCVVFGMPKEAMERGGVSRVVSLQSMAAAVLSAMK